MTDAGSGGGSGAAGDAGRTWLRIAAGCMLLIGVAFIQAPGLMMADTKFDLVADPAGFLARSLHLWDGSAAFGQLQNQAYGYLWPMGPFFALGDAVDLPGWVVQRLWMALVMCVAFVGTACLARAMGVRSDAATLIAAFAFATSPRLLSTLGPISIEAWPSALAPWVLLPLVIGATRGSPRRMAMLSGVAISMIGGVNAAATSAVLPLGVVWLLTREKGPRRRSLMIWWPVFTALGTLWWLVPLLVMGSYSPPFLDFIESASVTTFPTTIFDSLRGTSAWVPYVDSGWQGGNDLITRFYLPLNSGLVLMLGLVGMMLRTTQHRLFLLVSLLVGLFMVTMGHEGAVQGWGAASLRDLLDGPLAPLRNVHKFDPVIRLPMVLGLAWLVDAAVTARGGAEIEIRSRTVVVSTHRVVVGIAVLGVLGASLPALAGRLAPEGAVLETPPYWDETVAWVDENADGTVALLAPGSGFGDYTWGKPRDEPMQYLSGDHWAVRNAIPLTPPGNIRMLDAFERRMTQGLGSPGMAAFLARAGVGHVVVRNDLAPSGDVPDPALVHQALQSSPGLELVQTFGPQVGGEAYLDTEDGRRLLVNGGWQERRAVIEIYEVAGAQSGVSASELPRVVGGPEDLLDLADAAVLGSEPTQLASDVDIDVRPEGPVILTDGLQQRERFFGRVHDGYSAVITPGDVRRSGNPVSDYEMPGGSRWQTTARLDGVASISASSSMSDANAVGGSRPGQLPFAVVDGAGETEWVSGLGSSDAAWWQMDLERPTSVSNVRITVGEESQAQELVRVVTDVGSSDPVRIRRGATESVPLGDRDISWIRVEDVGGDGRPLALAEVSFDGLDVRRELVLPEVPEAWGSPSAILLRTLSDARTGCATIEGDTRCLRGREVMAEEPQGFDRRLMLPTSETYAPELTARPRPGTALDAIVQRDQPLNVTASSTVVRDPRVSGLAAADGDVGTTWTAAPDDVRPQLTMNWLGRRAIRGVTVSLDANAPARRPTVVELTWPGGKRKVELDDDGSASFPVIRTDQMTVRIIDSSAAISVDATGNASRVPVGVSELRLSGLPFAPIAVPTGRRNWPCGTGPSLVVNGRSIRTALVASPSELFAMESVETRLCDEPDELKLHAGENLLRSERSSVAVADRLVLDAGTTITPALQVPVTRGEPVERGVVPAAGSSVVVVRENQNPGWVATQGSDDTLDPVVIDGWQQGWRTNGSEAPVSVSFGPDRAYRGGLFAGFALFAVLVAIALIPRRRWPGTSLPALGDARVPAPALSAAAVLVGGVLGGWGGAACALVGLVVGGATVRWLRPAGEWAIGGLLMLASFGYFLRPWGDPQGWAGTWAWPHYLVLVAVSAAVVVSVAPRRRSLRRMNGSSIVR